ncbi:MAG: biotin/lipoyl-binding protein, partial [Planctomycetales bacterium]|nr:biotin/lipoyl-binding protein [Planctomycetales bacterium]
MTNHTASSPSSSDGEAAEAKSGLVASIMKGLPTLLVLTVMAGGWMLMHHINSGGSITEEQADAVEQETVSDTLVLPQGKLTAGKFESVPAQSHVVQHAHTVPGRLRYDQTQHVDVKAPMDGILAELVVTPGDHVNAGDLIAV